MHFTIRVVNLLITFANTLFSFSNQRYNVTIIMSSAAQFLLVTTKLHLNISQLILFHSFHEPNQFPLRQEHGPWKAIVAFLCSSFHEVILTCSNEGIHLLSGSLFFSKHVPPFAELFNRKQY